MKETTFIQLGFRALLLKFNLIPCDKKLNTAIKKKLQNFFRSIAPWLTFG